jgi:hypothetical protein
MGRRTRTRTRTMALAVLLAAALLASTAVAFQLQPQHAAMRRAAGGGFSSSSSLSMSSDPPRPRKVKKMPAPRNTADGVGGAMGFPPLTDPFPPLRMRNYRLKQGQVLVRFINLPTEGREGQPTEVMETAMQGESLISVASRVGVRIPTSCRTGICGTCTMDLEDPNWKQYGSYRPGYVPFKTCVAKVTVPAGHYEMVVDVYRMRKGSGRVPGDLKTLTVTELGDAMARFEDGWEEDYKGNKLPRPDFIGNGRVVRKLGDTEEDDQHKKSLEYFERRKEDREIQRLMKDRLAAGAKRRAMGTTERLGRLTHDHTDPELMDIATSESPGIGNARAIGYLRSQFPRPQERHPLKETNPRELARQRMLNPPVSTQYPGTDYFFRDDRWDPLQRNLNVPYVRALVRPLPRVPARNPRQPRHTRPPSDMLEYILNYEEGKGPSPSKFGVDDVLDAAAGRDAPPMQPRRKSPRMRAVCTKCEGKGHLSCAFCKGEGYKYDVDGRGAQTRLECSACSGNGGMDCDRCLGSGNLR